MVKLVANSYCGTVRLFIAIFVAFSWPEALIAHMLALEKSSDQRKPHLLWKVLRRRLLCLVLVGG